MFRKISHCLACKNFNKFCTRNDVPEDCKDFLRELWWNHQDLVDNLLCWNAWCSVFNPDEVVQIDDE